MLQEEDSLGSLSQEQRDVGCWLGRPLSEVPGQRVLCEGPRSGHLPGGGEEGPSVSPALSGRQAVFVSLLCIFQRRGCTLTLPLSFTTKPTSSLDELKISKSK